ncbi:GAF domain-containing protein [Haloimpatiens sp. FM7315]|uniref:GAF domain-containing protein n=1 Tax=Haloimpatiens sp. FM7315 TaxID=3298609 RepID=UPI0035A2E559
MAFKLDAIEKMNTEDKYRYMNMLLTAQLSSEEDLLANLSNASAIVNVAFDRINWVGFYLMKNRELVLGPFQGRPACNRIKYGCGVCGTAVKERRVIRVENVHEFEGHIACDSASNSEIVIPIIVNDEVFGVLDIDSPEFNRFLELEEGYLIKFVDKLKESIIVNSLK